MLLPPPICLPFWLAQPQRVDNTEGLTKDPFQTVSRLRPYFQTLRKEHSNPSIEQTFIRKGSRPLFKICSNIHSLYRSRRKSKYTSHCASNSYQQQIKQKKQVPIVAELSTMRVVFDERSKTVKGTIREIEKKPALYKDHRKEKIPKTLKKFEELMHEECANTTMTPYSEQEGNACLKKMRPPQQNALDLRSTASTNRCESNLKSLLRKAMTAKGIIRQKIKGAAKTNELLQRTFEEHISPWNQEGRKTISSVND